MAKPCAAKISCSIVTASTMLEKAAAAVAALSNHIVREVKFESNGKGFRKKRGEEKCDNKCSLARRLVDMDRGFPVHPLPLLKV